MKTPQSVGRAHHQGNADPRQPHDRRPGHLPDLDRHSLLRSHAGVVREARRLRSEAQSHRRSGCGSAPHGRRRRHRAGAVVREGARGPQGHQSRGLLRAADGRNLAVVAVDLGGRPALVYQDRVRVRLVGDLQTELVEDFFGGFVNHAGANLHAKVLYGRSNHHKIEAIFKCFARAMRYACSTDERLKDQLPSTKGCCCDFDFRLRRGKFALGAEYSGRDRRGVRTDPRCGGHSQSDQAHSAGRRPFWADDARAG